MVKKAIAAALLVVIAAWAEMAMAPMLAMYAGHMRAGHTMAADMPQSHPAHRHHPQPLSEQAPTAHHACCPGLHDAPSMIEVASSTPGCDGSHSCCFRQGPQSVPAAAGRAQNVRRDATPAPMATAAGRPATAKAFNAAFVAVDTPPDLFRVILRV
ncbi:MAG: hypothetical protein WB817_19870 [Terriglobales bacterium]